MYGSVNSMPGGIDSRESSHVEIVAEDQDLLSQQNIQTARTFLEGFLFFDDLLHDLFHSDRLLNELLHVFFSFKTDFGPQLILVYHKINKNSLLILRSNMCYTQNNQRPARDDYDRKNDIFLLLAKILRQVISPNFLRVETLGKTLGTLVSAVLKFTLEKPAASAPSGDMDDVVVTLKRSVHAAPPPRDRRPALCSGRAE